MAEVLADYLLQRGSVAHVPLHFPLSVNSLATNANTLTTRHWIKARATPSCCAATSTTTTNSSTTP
jgi:hypothetical protein